MLPLCASNAEVLLRALTSEGLRLDGRDLLSYRRVIIAFKDSNGNVEVSLGHTRCICQVSAAPFRLLPADRANDGDVSFRVSLAPAVAAAAALRACTSTATAAALAAAEGSSRRSVRSGEKEKEAERLLRKLLKDTGVVDTEALCIQSGKWAWHVKACITIFDEDGNMLDACLLAAVCGLLHFRKQAVSIEEGEAVLYSATERDPLPLCLHHLPVLVSFAFLPPFSAATARRMHSESEVVVEEVEEERRRSGKKDQEKFCEASAGLMASSPTQQSRRLLLHQAAGDTQEEEELLFVVDPSAAEEAILPGKISIAVSKQGELCGLHKMGGPALRYVDVQRLISLAVKKAGELTSIVTSAVEEERDRRKRLLRRNARSRYDAECVTLEMPDARTLSDPFLLRASKYSIDMFSVAADAGASALKRMSVKAATDQKLRAPDEIHLVTKQAVITASCETELPEESSHASEGIPRAKNSNVITSANYIKVRKTE